MLQKPRSNQTYDMSTTFAYYKIPFMLQVESGKESISGWAYNDVLNTVLEERSGKKKARTIMKLRLPKHGLISESSHFQKSSILRSSLFLSKEARKVSLLKR